MPTIFQGMHTHDASVPDRIGSLAFERDNAFSSSFGNAALRQVPAPIYSEKSNLKQDKRGWGAVGKRLLDGPAKTITRLKNREWEAEIFSFAKVTKGRRYIESPDSRKFTSHVSITETLEPLSRVPTLPPYRSSLEPASRRGSVDLSAQAVKVQAETAATLDALERMPSAALKRSDDDHALARKIAGISSRIVEKRGKLDEIPDGDTSLYYGWTQGIRCQSDLEFIQAGLHKFGNDWQQRAQARADKPRWHKFNPFYGVKRCIGKDKSALAAIENGMACVENRSTRKKPLLHVVAMNILNACRRHKVKEKPESRINEQQAVRVSVADRFKALTKALRPGDTIELFDEGKIGIENTTTPYINILGLLPGFSIYPDVRALRKKSAGIKLSVGAESTSLSFGSRDKLDGHIGVTPYVGVQLGFVQPGLYVGLSAGAERSQAKDVSIHVTGTLQEREAAIHDLLECLFSTHEGEKAADLWHRFAKISVDRGNVSIGLRDEINVKSRVTGHITGTLYEGSPQLTGSESIRQELEVNPHIRVKQQDTGPAYNRTIVGHGSAWAANLEVQSALWPPATMTGSADTSFGTPGLNVFSARTKVGHGGHMTTYSIAHNDDGYLRDKTYRYVSQQKIKGFKKLIGKQKVSVENSIGASNVEHYFDAVENDKNKKHMEFVYQSVMSDRGEKALNGISLLENEILQQAANGFSTDWRAFKKETKNIDNLKKQVLKDEQNWEPLKLDAYFNRTDQSNFRGLNYVFAAQSRKGASLQRKICSTDDAPVLSSGL